MLQVMLSQHLAVIIPFFRDVNHLLGALIYIVQAIKADFEKLAYS